MAKGKQQELALEEKLKQALVPEDEWPYKVPGNWVWVKLGSQLNELESGFACAKRNELPPNTENAYPHLRPNNIGYFGKLNLEKVVYIPFEMVEISKSTIEKGDILFNNTNSVELVGRCVCVHEHRNAAFSNHITRLRVLKNAPLLPEFIAHFINMRWGEGYFANICKKWVGQAGVDKDNLLILPIPLPPLAEQQRIVDRIESLFAKLDQAKELAQNALDTFETRKAAILHKAFTGELTAKWREKNGVGMESWEETTLGKIIKVSSGKSLTTKDMHHEGNIPVYGGNGITGYHDESNVEANTIVIGRVGFYCGSVHYINQKAWVTDNALIVKFNTNNIDIKFMYRLLSYIDLRKNDSSTAQPVISGSKIYPLKVIIPTLSEQREIVRILDSLFEKEQKAKELCDVIDKIDLIKKAILAKAFRGELGTNGHNEESAVELLKECLGQSFN